jgi:hypothetical protein
MVVLASKELHLLNELFFRGSLTHEQLRIETKHFINLAEEQVSKGESFPAHGIIIGESQAAPALASTAFMNVLTFTHFAGANGRELGAESCREGLNAGKTDRWRRARFNSPVQAVAVGSRIYGIEPKNETGNRGRRDISDIRAE